MRDGGSLHVDAMDTLGITDAPDGDGALPVPKEAGPRGAGPPSPSFGTVFVLTGRGLRHMGRPAGNGAAAEGFLGYPPENLFWKDLRGLLHPDEREGFEALISDVKASPCTSESVELRLLDGLGRWRPVEAAVLNVLEAPDGLDGGLLVVNVRDLSARETGDGVG